MRRHFSLLSLVPWLALFLGCKSAPPEDPDAVDWSSYEQARAPAPPASSPPEPKPPATPPTPRRSRHSPPREVRVIRNQEPPFGYTEVTTPNWTLFALGLSIATLAYVPPALISTQLGGNAWTMQIPIAGPIMQIGYTIDHYSQQGGLAYPLLQVVPLGYYFVFLTALSLAQGGGLVIATVGLFEKQKHWVRSDLALVDTPSFGMNLRFPGNALQLHGRF